MAEKRRRPRFAEAKPVPGTLMASSSSARRARGTSQITRLAMRNDGPIHAISGASEANDLREGMMVGRS